MKAARLILIVLVVLTGMFDLATFLYNHQYSAFESNPVWHLTHSIVFLIIFKVAVLALFCWVIMRGSSWGWLSYAVVLTALYNVAGQIYGGISNLQVAAAHPAPSQILPPDVAVQTYITLAVVWQLLPLFMATIAYQMHKWGGYNA